MIDRCHQEKSKYDRMHNIPGYSPGPGVAHVRTARAFMVPGCSVIDFGTGTGDAAAVFMDLGHTVQAVDISRAGLRHDLPFFECSLIDLPEELTPAEWGFCSDVMEHLPEEWVEDALRSMCGKCRNCFFSICGIPDSWGAKIGQTLHLTVRPVSWWFDRLRKYWADVQLVEDTGSIFIFVCRGPREN